MMQSRSEIIRPQRPRGVDGLLTPYLENRWAAQKGERGEPNPRARADYNDLGLYIGTRKLPSPSIPFEGLDAVKRWGSRPRRDRGSAARRSSSPVIRTARLFRAARAQSFGSEVQYATKESLTSFRSVRSVRRARDRGLAFFCFIGTLRRGGAEAAAASYEYEAARQKKSSRLRGFLVSPCHGDCRRHVDDDKSGWARRISPGRPRMCSRNETLMSASFGPGSPARRRNCTVR